MKKQMTSSEKKLIHIEKYKGELGRIVNLAYEQGKKDAEHDMELKNKYKSTFNYTAGHVDIIKKLIRKQTLEEVLKVIKEEMDRLRAIRAISSNERDSIRYSLSILFTLTGWLEQELKKVSE